MHVLECIFQNLISIGFCLEHSQVDDLSRLSCSTGLSQHSKLTPDSHHVVDACTQTSPGLVDTEANFGVPLTAGTSFGVPLTAGTSSLARADVGKEYLKPSPVALSAETLEGTVHGEKVHWYCM